MSHLPHAPRRPCLLRIRLGDGRSELVARHRCWLPFSVFGHRYHLWFYVLPTLSAPVILGLPFLVHCRPSVPWTGTPVPDDAPTPEFFPLAGLRAACRKGATVIRVSLAAITADPPVPPEPPPPEVTALLDEFKDVLSPPTSLPPHRGAFDHRIKLVPGAKLPRTRPPYPLSAAERQELSRQITLLVSRGWLTPVSRADHAASVFFVRKKNGKFRLVVDWRGLNAVTVPSVYPLPRAESLIANLHGSTVFTTLDLSEAFHQVRLSEDSLPHSVITTELGLFRFEVMSFGVTDAPATFQSLMDSVLRGLVGVEVYLDDVMVHSASLDEHIPRLRGVLSRLRSASLHLGLPKCHFAASEVEWLGRHISAAGVSPSPDKIAAVSQWPPPSSPTELRAFLGLCNWLRPFVPRYAELAQPLYALSSARRKWEWCLVHDDAFRALKSALASPGVLAIPDPAGPFVLQADASSIGLGACLLFRNRPVAFASRSLTTGEQRWCIRDKELRSFAFAARHFRHYLAGATTVFQTDHAALLDLKLDPHTATTVVRDALYLEQFRHKWNLVPSRQMTYADALSRYPRAEDTTTTTSALAVCTHPSTPVFFAAKSALVYHPEMFSRFTAAYQKDPFTKHIFDDLHRSPPIQNFVSSTYSFQDGLIVVTPSALSTEHHRILVPRDRTLIADILHLVHSSAAVGHPGRLRTLSLARRHFVWKGMRKDVFSFVDSCPVCQTVKPRSNAAAPPLRPLEPPSTRWSAISMDFKTGLPLVNNCDSVLVVTDRFSRRVRLIPTTKSVTASATAFLILDHVVKLHGLPDSIVSDRDPRFTSEVWSTLWSAFDSRLRMSVANHPETDGSTERAIRAFRQILTAILATQGGDWFIRLPLTEIALNLAVCQATGMSPFVADLGRVPRTPLDVVLPPDAPASAVEMQAHLRQIAADVSETSLYSRTTQARHADRASHRRHSSPVFSVGDHVLVHRAALRDPDSSSTPSVFRRHFLGPFRIVEMVSPSAVRLLLDPDTTAHDVVNVKFIRRFHHDQWPERSTPPPSPNEGEFYVRSVLRHRGPRSRPADVRFETRWLGYDDTSWEPASSFFDDGVWNAQFLAYHRRHHRSLPSIDRLAQAALDR